jgi:hypothetical protein
MRMWQQSICALLGWLLLAGLAPAAESAPEEPANPGKDAEVKPAAVTLQDRFEHVRMEAQAPGEVASVGERLRYLVKYKGLPAGQAIFAVKRRTVLGGRPVLYITLESESNDAISLLYPVRDKVKSYIDAETGHSLRFDRHLREGRGGSFTAVDTLQFDYEQNRQIHTAIEFDGSVRKERREERPIPGPVQDPLSVLYYLRHFPLEVGASRQVLVGAAEEINVLAVQTRREEEVHLPALGVFDAYVVELRNQRGEQTTAYQAQIFHSRGDVTVWVEKNTNIPLVVKTGVPVLGSTSAVLQSAEACDLLQHRKRRE